MLRCCAESDFGLVSSGTLRPLYVRGAIQCIRLTPANKDFRGSGFGFRKQSASERLILAGLTQRVCEGGKRFAVQNVENGRKLDGEQNTMVGANSLPEPR